MESLKNNIIALLILVFIGYSSTSASGEIEKCMSGLDTKKISSEKLNVSYINKESKIRFYEDGPSPLTDENTNILAVVVLPDYRFVYLDVYMNDGGIPQASDVFTYDIDNDNQKELVVICTWEQIHSGLNTNGTYYKVYIYDDSITQVKGNIWKAREMTAEMAKFGEGFHGTQEGKAQKFQFRTSADIIAKLSNNGSDVLKNAHKNALALFKAGKKKEAAQTLLNGAGAKPWVIDGQNVAIYNDLGYFLEQAADYQTAYEILLEIIQQVPSRTVAYLNLADVFYAMGDEEEARNSYKVYEQKMTLENKADKIPKRVFERSK